MPHRLIRQVHCLNGGDMGIIEQKISQTELGLRQITQRIQPVTKIFEAIPTEVDQARSKFSNREKRGVVFRWNAALL
jgi:hypothetical protein